MTFNALVNRHADAVLDIFWSSVAELAESVDPTEAFALLRHAALGRLRAAKPSGAVDYSPDARSARWRVRVTLWRGDPKKGDLHADSDYPAPVDAPGATLIHGLPAVAKWVWDLIQQAHPPENIQEISLASITARLRTLRVALSNGGGACAWRLRYSVTGIPGTVAGARSWSAAAPSEPVSVAYMAFIQVGREEPSPRRLSKLP